jgi:hypothetical protein
MRRYSKILKKFFQNFQFLVIIFVVMKVLNILQKKISFSLVAIPFELAIIVVSAVICTILLFFWDLFFDSKIFESNFFSKHPIVKSMIGIFVGFFIVMMSRLGLFSETESIIQISFFGAIAASGVFFMILFPFFYFNKYNFFSFGIPPILAFLGMKIGWYLHNIDRTIDFTWLVYFLLFQIVIYSLVKILVKTKPELLKSTNK